MISRLFVLLGHYAIWVGYLNFTMTEFLLPIAFAIDSLLLIPIGITSMGQSK